MCKKQRGSDRSRRCQNGCTQNARKQNQGDDRSVDFDALQRQMKFAKSLAALPVYEIGAMDRAKAFEARRDAEFAAFLESFPEDRNDRQLQVRLGEFLSFQALDFKEFYEANERLTRAFESLAASGQLTQNSRADLEYYHRRQNRELAQSIAQGEEDSDALAALLAEQKAERDYLLATAPRDPSNRPHHSQQAAEEATLVALGAAEVQGSGQDEGESDTADKALAA